MFGQFAIFFNINHPSRTHLSAINVRLACKACPKALAPLSSMLLCSKLRQYKKKKHGHCQKQVASAVPVLEATYHTHFSNVSVLLICRACARALAPSEPILLLVKLHVTEPRYLFWYHVLQHCIHAYSSNISVRLIFRASPRASAPSTPMSMRFKLCVWQKHRVHQLAISFNICTSKLCSHLLQCAQCANSQHGPSDVCFASPQPLQRPNQTEAPRSA